MNGTRTVRSGGSVLRFLRWWWGELSPLLPRWLVLALYPPRESLLIVPGEERWQIARLGNGDPQWVASVEDPPEPGELARALETGRRQCLNPAPALVCLFTGQRVLHAPCTLPAAAMSDVRQALAYEMDRYTPFTADQVCFDYRVHDAERSGAGQVSLELFVVPREDIERVRERLAGAGLHPHAIDIPRASNGEAEAGRDSPPLPAGINLLSPAERHHPRRLRLRANAGLAGVLLLLVGGLMYQGHMAGQQREARLQGLVAEAREEARRSIDLRRRIRDIREAGQVLQSVHERRPAISDLLYLLTTELPADAWLSRIDVRGNRIELRGHAGKPAEVVSRLERALDIGETEFRVSTSEEGRENGERSRFDLSARLGTVGSAADGEAP